MATQNLVPADLTLTSVPIWLGKPVEPALLTMTPPAPTKTGDKTIPPADLVLQAGGPLLHRGVLLTTRWRFYDPELDETWVVPINPDSMSNPLKPKTLSYGRHAGSNARYATLKQLPRPVEWEFAGVIRTQTHHDTLDDWLGRRRIIQITDHISRTFEVMLTSFEVTERKPTKTNAWRLRYSMKALLLRQLS